MCLIPSQSGFEFHFFPTMSLGKYLFRDHFSKRYLNGNKILFKHFVDSKHDGMIHVKCDQMGSFEWIQTMSEKPKSQLPEMIIMNESAWFFFIHADTIDNLFVLDYFAIQGKKTLFKSLEKLASKTKVVMLYPPIFKDYVRKSMVSDLARTNDFTQEGKNER